MIPLRDIEPRQRHALVTTVLVAMNLGVWIYMLTLVDDARALRAFFEEWAFRWPAQIGPLVAGRATFASLAPFVTHQFVHAGWLHIGGNMVFLWALGGAVESRVGHLRFLLLYLVSGCVAAVGQAFVQIALADRAGLVGASGAISGVLGAYLVLAPGSRVRTLVPLGVFVTVLTLPGIVVIGEWFVLQVIAAINVLRLVDPEAATVAYFAHLTGFASGVVLAAAPKLARRAATLRSRRR